MRTLGKGESMNSKQLTLLLARYEGPKLEFKLQYSLDGQGSDREKDEVAKDILSLANSLGHEPAFIVIGAGDSVDAFGKRAARCVRGRGYSEQRFLKLFNERCSPPLGDLKYTEIDIEDVVYGVLEIPSSKNKPHKCVRDLVTPKRTWPQNSILVRRGDQIGLASLEEVNLLQTETKAWRASQLGHQKSQTDRDPLRGVHAVRIRTPLDFKNTIGADAARHSVLFKASSEKEREVRGILSDIFSDLPYIDHDEMGMVMTYLDGIEESLSRLTELGAEIFCVMAPERYIAGDKPFTMTVANYLFITQDCFLFRADIEQPVIHRFSDECRDSLLDVVANLRSDKPVQICAAPISVWKRFGMKAPWCTTCCTQEIEAERVFVQMGLDVAKLEELAKELHSQSEASEATATR